MLADPRFNPELHTPEYSDLRKLFSRVREGIYHGTLSWVLAVEQREYNLEFPTVGRTLREMQNRPRTLDENPMTTRLLDEVGEFGSYGSCDSIEQFMATPLGKWIVESPRKFAISFQYLKADNEQDGGYRWHKNGEYIGSLGAPECEYLKDEPIIREIFQFQVIEVA